jgi:hypothetical protein
VIVLMTPSAHSIAERIRSRSRSVPEDRSAERWRGASGVRLFSMIRCPARNATVSA